jgi:NRPS condensation-like uncharacterized protein
MKAKNIEYRRKLQGHERRHFRAPNSIIPLVVRIRGDVKKNNVVSAMKKVQQRHLLLRVRVEIDQTNTAWFTTEGVKEIPLKILERTSDDQWISLCARESKSSFEFYTRPLIRIIILYSPEKSDLILFCHHMVCDGMSVAFLARDFMEVLGDQQKELEILPPPPLVNRENIPHDITDNVLVHKFIQRINKKWKNEEVVFDHNDYLSIFNAYWKNNLHHIQTIELTEKQTEALVQKCRQENVTINSMILAAFLKAQYEAKARKKPEKQKAGIAVDVRNYLLKPAGESFGFYAAGIMDRYTYRETVDFWEMTRKLHRMITKKLAKKEFFKNLLRAGALEPSMHDALIMKTYGHLVQPTDSRYQKLSSFSQKKDSISSMAKKLGAMHFGFAITNLGRLDFPRYYGDLELERFLIFPPTGPTIETTIFVATVSGKLTLIMAYIESTIHTPIMVQLKESLLQWLLSCC